MTAVGKNIPHDSARGYVTGEAIYVDDTPFARNELLVSLAPRPIKDYKLNMTESQRASAGWVLLAGMPGGVLLIGSMVWLRRRS